MLFYVRFLPEIEFYFQVDFRLLDWRAPMTLGVGLLCVSGKLPRINTNRLLSCIFLFHILVVNDSCFVSTLVFAFNVLHYCIQCVLLLVLANDHVSCECTVCCMCGVVGNLRYVCRSRV